MPSTHQFVALPAETFAPWFDLNDSELRARGARRVVVDSQPGFPCRVSLADAAVGETVLLLPFVHLDVASPYRASGPIFVRRGVATARPAPGAIPAMFTHRLLSLRAYDGGDMMIAAEVVAGTELAAALDRLFGDREVRYLHLHNARPGCFNCRVDRVEV